MTSIVQSNVKRLESLINDKFCTIIVKRLESLINDKFCTIKCQKIGKPNK